MDRKRKSQSFVLPPEPSDDPHHRPPMTARLSTSPEILGKVCFICDCLPADNQPGDFSYGYDPSDVNYCLFLLDLDAERESTQYVNRNPYLCFNRYLLGIDGFFILGSTLYFFDGRAMFSYELPSSFPLAPQPQEVITLNPDMLCSAPPCMNYPKYEPWGCQTPDGEKMVVFSTTLYICRGRSEGNFELFDRRTKTWTTLPDVEPLLSRCWRKSSRGFSYYYSDDTFAELRSYSFIDDDGRVLLINTSVGNFSLNIEKPESGWSPCDKFRFVHDDGFHICMLVRGSLRLMDWFSWADADGTDQEKKLSYPGFSSVTDKVIGGGMTWLSPKDRFCLCAVKLMAQPGSPF